MRKFGPAGILCHYCGRDYAREYWAMGRKADQYVCKSCRRDLNPDAADAPHWVKPIPLAEAVDSFMEKIVTARKKCRVCGGEWDGYIFGPSDSTGSTLPLGICDPCADKDEAEMRAMSARVVPVGIPLDLHRPRRVHHDD